MLGFSFKTPGRAYAASYTLLANTQLGVAQEGYADSTGLSTGAGWVPLKQAGLSHSPLRFAQVTSKHYTVTLKRKYYFTVCSPQHWDTPEAACHTPPELYFITGGR